MAELVGMSKRDGANPYLSGQLLVAMPGMTDPRFEKTVIYMCAHNADGAMGLVVNRPIESMTFPEMLEQLNIPAGDDDNAIRVLFGGPVEQ
ncbi:MAG: YqgE/AlgH family protein, partial [Rhodospirillaceae bacterium]